MSSMEPMPNEPDYAAWWCPNCKDYIPWHEVTFHELHDERCGGCGNKVLPEKMENKE